MPLIRDYRAQDLDALKALSIEIQDYERQFDASLRAGATVAAEYVDELLEISRQHAGRILVAESDGVVTGMVAFRTIKPIEHERPHMYISDLVVLPSHRRLGLGRALLAAVEAGARREGIDRILLMVYAKNRIAREVYEDCGFETLELQMVKRVTP